MDQQCTRRFLFAHVVSPTVQIGAAQRGSAGVWECESVGCVCTWTDDGLMRVWVHTCRIGCMLPANRNGSVGVWEYGSMGVWECGQEAGAQDWMHAACKP
eukprot:357980-Chlamydomonas_euryale.AAC.4